MTYERIYRHETGLRGDYFKNFITNLRASFAQIVRGKKVARFYDRELTHKVCIIISRKTQ